MWLLVATVSGHKRFSGVHKFSVRAHHKEQVTMNTEQMTHTVRNSSDGQYF